MLITKVNWKKKKKVKLHALIQKSKHLTTLINKAFSFFPLRVIVFKLMIFKRKFALMKNINYALPLATLAGAPDGLSSSQAAIQVTIASASLSK